MTAVEEKPLLIVIVARGMSGDEDEFNRYNLELWKENSEKQNGSVRIKSGLHNNDRIYIIQPFDKKDLVINSFDNDITSIFQDSVNEFMQAIFSYLDQYKIKDYISESDCLLLVHWGGGNNDSINNNEKNFRMALKNLFCAFPHYEQFFYCSLSSLRRDIIDVSGIIRIPVGQCLRKIVQRAKNYDPERVKEIEDIKVKAFNNRFEHEFLKEHDKYDEYIGACKELGIINKEK